MAPHARPFGAPSMGGIFNDLNSTHAGEPHPFPGLFNGFPGPVVRARDLMARSSDGGASTALIIAIVVPTFFIILGLVAILHHAMKIRKIAKAKRAARRAARRARSERSGCSSRSGSGSGSSRAESTRSLRPGQSHGEFSSVPFDSPSPAYMASSRRSDRSAVSDYGESF